MAERVERDLYRLTKLIPGAGGGNNSRLSISTDEPKRTRVTLEGRNLSAAARQLHERRPWP